MQNAHLTLNFTSNLIYGIVFLDGQVRKLVGKQNKYHEKFLWLNFFQLVINIFYRISILNLQSLSVNLCSTKKLLSKYYVIIAEQAISYEFNFLIILLTRSTS